MGLNRLLIFIKHDQRFNYNDRIICRVSFLYPTYDECLAVLAVIIL